jgi:hypothetical protein
MADEARALAAVWDGACKAGGGDGVAAGALGPVDPGELKKRYVSESFIPSLDLDHIGGVLEGQ